MDAGLSMLKARSRLSVLYREKQIQHADRTEQRTGLLGCPVTGCHPGKPLLLFKLKQKLLSLLFCTFSNTTA